MEKGQKTEATERNQTNPSSSESKTPATTSLKPDGAAGVTIQESTAIAGQNTNEKSNIHLNIHHPDLSKADHSSSIQNSEPGLTAISAVPSESVSKPLIQTGGAPSSSTSNVAGSTSSEQPPQQAVSTQPPTASSGGNLGPSPSIANPKAPASSQASGHEGTTSAASSDEAAVQIPREAPARQETKPNSPAPTRPPSRGGVSDSTQKPLQQLRSTDGGEDFGLAGEARRLPESGTSLSPQQQGSSGAQGHPQNLTSSVTFHSTVESRSYTTENSPSQPSYHTTSSFAGTPSKSFSPGQRSPSPRKEDRPEATQHIDYTVTESPARRPMSSPSTLVDSQAKPQLLGTSELNRTTIDSRGMSFSPNNFQDSMLSMAEVNSMVEGFKNGVRHAGWLYKLVGKTPLDVNWKRYWFYIAEDRLYYTADPSQGRTSGKTRYICLDRMPVRPLPHRRLRFDPSTMTSPDVGVSLVDNKVLCHLGVRLKPNTCFGLVSGTHTYFLSADTPEEARGWVKALRSTWLHCYQHTLRGTVSVQPGIADTSRLLAVNQSLTASLRDMEGKAAGADSEYWKNWLEEKARNRELEDKLVDLAYYEIEVKTGKMKGSCTDARVYLEMFGPYDNVTTGELRLVNADSHQRCFTRDALDLFMVTAKNVGLPNHIKVWHDNTGRHPSWFLDYIRIRKRETFDKVKRSGGKTVNNSGTLVFSGSPAASKHPGMNSSPGPGSASKSGVFNVGAGPWAVFPCGRWFSTELDDCRISRMLFVGHSTPLIQYKVEVLTSDLRGAGTEANVHMIMHGTLGDGQRHLLTSGHDDFSRGAANVFTVDDEELGELLEVTVGHDNTGYSASWHLDHMAITNEKTGQRFLFSCRQWFDTRIGDGLIERRLPVSEALGQAVYYTFSITTSDIKGAGTDADVHVALHGDLGDTPTTILPSNPEHFERGLTDTFRLQLPNVGRIRTLTIGHNNRGPGPEWHLQMVEVLDEGAGKKYYFSCNKWLGLGVGDNLLERTLVAVEENPSANITEYKLDFHTSKLRGAGTDATVYFQLVGEKGDGEVTRIVAPKAAFERGTVDTFIYKMAYLGKLQKLLIQHDNSGLNPAWHLFKVDVTCAKDKQCTVFVCNDWLKSDIPEVYPSVELIPGRPVPRMMKYRLDIFTTDLKGATTTSNVHIEMHGHQGKIGPVHLDHPTAYKRGQKDIFEVEGHDLGPLTKLVVSLDGAGQSPAWNLDYILVHRDASLADSADAAVYFPCRQWFDKERGMSKELFPKTQREEEKKIEYNVRVFTSDLKGAGTDSNVFITLFGESGDTGEVPLLAAHDTFERAQVDVFPLLMRDVGRPAFLVVRTDGSSRKPTWHLDMAVVESSRYPPAYFLAQKMMGPDTLMSIRLPVAWSNPKDDQAMYEIHVFTSDIKNSGTDAGIAIEILGDKASSGKHDLLDMSKDTFERGQMDTFHVQCRNLGVLHAVRVMSDGRSAKPSWHLDRIVIKAPSGEVYFFPYQDWISAQTKLKVEIPASLLDPTLTRRSYKIVTLTSDLPGAGTDANVFIDIHGSAASTGRVPLKNDSRNPFERGQSDEFNLPWGLLGDLHEIVIGHDNSGRSPQWHLEQVEITDVQTGQTWYFECNNWLGVIEGHSKLEWLLPALRHNPRAMRTTYIIVVNTAELPGASTDSQVYVDLMGDQANTGRTMLRNSNHRNFLTGQSDEFRITCRTLGNIRQLLVGHDNSGLQPAWHPQVISVTDTSTQTTYWFDAYIWFDRNQGDGLIERILMPLSAPPPPPKTMVTYQVVVVTSDIAGAGTDARVHLVMFGQDGSNTGRLALDKPGTNLFERGQRDVFEVQALEVDPLFKLLVGHDNSGHGGSWHLAYVEVTNRATGARYHFPCKRWLSTTEDDGQIQRELFLGNPDPPAPPKPPPPPNEYLIEVITSDISGAGTDANVRCVLIGDAGETPTLTLDRAGHNDFERGKTDSFVVPAPDVGELRYLKIWHDNSGLGAAWHLEMVIVSSKANPNQKYYFYCGQWLDKEHGVEKMLHVSFTDPRANMPLYTIIMHTSNIKNAGTDAHVFVNLFGSGGESGARELTGRGNLFEAGKSDTFPFKMPDLGDLSLMEVWHDNSGLGPGWHLDYAEVHNSATGAVVYFPCQQWFDKTEGDGLIRRRLQATLKDPRTFKAQYRVTVWTSNIFGAGTDANVFIQISGEEGETSRVNLDNPGRNDFETNQMDVFEFQERNVGKMRKIRIGHDNSGFGAAWHCAKVIVENNTTGESATFEINDWFSKDKGDGQIERDYVPTFSGGINWKLTIVTGEERGAGTDADVFVELFGSAGSFGPYMLAAQKGGFESGMHDVFSVSTPDLGQIVEMALSHNDKGFGASWQVDTAELENMSTGEKYFFDFKVWLDKQRGLRAVRRPSGYRGPVSTISNYRLEVTTGPNDDSRLVSGQVFMNIKGDRGATGPQDLTLPQQGFQPLRIEAYALMGLKDTGSIKQLEVMHTAPHPWFLSEVLVLNESTGVQGLFKADRLIMPNVATLLEAVALPPVDYRVEVKTSDRFQAGTSAKVFCNLYGAQGSTGRNPLEYEDEASVGSLPKVFGDKCGTGGRAFKRNAMDTFILKGQTDVGRMKQLEVSHDDTGLGAGWHLAWVRVTNLRSGEVANFPCNQWLTKNEGDKKIERLLDAENASEHVPPPVVAAGQPHADLATATAVINPVGGAMPFTSTLLRKMGGTVGEPGYRITFNTSNVVMGGTSSPVFFELIGENGSSGTVLTRPAPGQFSRGSSDSFVYPRLPFLGDLLQIRVGTTGEGMFATWHVRTVEAVHVATGERWVFNCHNWIDKKVQWCRVLAAIKQ